MEHLLCSRGSLHHGSETPAEITPPFRLPRFTAETTDKINLNIDTPSQNIHKESNEKVLDDADNTHHGLIKQKANNNEDDTLSIYDHQGHVLPGDSVITRQRANINTSGYHLQRRKKNDEDLHELYLTDSDNLSPVESSEFFTSQHHIAGSSIKTKTNSSGYSSYHLNGNLSYQSISKGLIPDFENDRFTVLTPIATNTLSSSIGSPYSSQLEQSRKGGYFSRVNASRPLGHRGIKKQSKTVPVSVINSFQVERDYLETRWAKETAFREAREKAKRAEYLSSVVKISDLTSKPTALHRSSSENSNRLVESLSRVGGNESNSLDGDYLSRRSDILDCLSNTRATPDSVKSLPTDKPRRTPCIVSGKGKHKRSLTCPPLKKNRPKSYNHLPLDDLKSAYSDLPLDDLSYNAETDPGRNRNIREAFVTTTPSASSTEIKSPVPWPLSLW